MSTSILLVVVFAALALGLSAVSLAVSLNARATARQALGLASAHEHVPANLPEERREHDDGPPEGQPERRRHRAPEGEQRYSRLRASADARETAEDPADAATTFLPVQPGPDPATAARPAPNRRALPPLPRPGAIRREP